jgi:hypothetical protein
MVPGRPDLALAAACAHAGLPACGTPPWAACGTTPAPGRTSLRDVEWLAGARVRVDADGMVVVREGLAIFVEDGLPVDEVVHRLLRLWRQLPPGLRVARAVHVLDRPAPGRETVNANAHVEAGTVWFWSPHGAPLLDLTTLAHELAHLLLPEPGHGHDAERDAFLHAWSAVIEEDRLHLRSVGLRAARYEKPRPGREPLLVDVSLSGGELRPHYAALWRVEEDHAESVGLYVRGLVQGWLGLREALDVDGQHLWLDESDERQRFAALFPARAAACAALLERRATLAA